ncbi:MAG: LysM peptidoglycan-binding domain-containing protein [Gammaproteobacteria bacterium]|nr:LysM peptidoglycan-binding domain-containing protein [Gammaproteobacteria bacterium]
MQRLFCLAVSLLALVLGACASTQNSDKESRGMDARASSHEAALAARRHKEKRTAADREAYDDVWDRVRDGFRLPELDSPHVDYYVEWYSKRPEYMERMMNRASLYLYHIVEELERNDFPMEIALLPAIESAYRPTAYSHAHAAGLWQFISATGSRYGLKQNWWYDGRRDVLGATEAAIQYLSFLRDEFDGDWFHALASYNTGERRVRRAILSNRRLGKPTGYQHLSLMNETERYVPKLLAVKRLVQDPARYGISLKPIPNRPYFAVVETGSQIDLSIVAESAGISTSELQALNAGFRRWATDPEGPHRVLVPVASKDRVVARLASIPQEERIRWASHDVRRGDTLGAIARRYGVSVSALQSSNRLNGTLIRTGQTLLVPLSSRALASSGGHSAPASGNRTAASPAVATGQWASYRVRPGDTLGGIGRRYGVSVSELRSGNGLSGSMIRVGQTLKVPATAGAGRQSGLHQVRAGDTLGGIARRYGVSVSDLRASNGLRGSLIRVGQTLKVPGKATGSAARQPIVHHVTRGDTLWRIARRYKVNIKQLQSWNQIATQDVLRLGQKIMVYAN